ncbi:tail fiber assembly protein [Yersinia enterocolitica]|uniref:tail fiber assembly protein n=1 Tax=Yersinia TaxID=629 RepID=UPI0032FF4450|nr:tail fiber assembly protein [Yersinia enterocolitica]HDL6983379.1 tail fiber assembly protein [Yersinia enterocolitica]HDL7065223.1 tail fiber assembly protein [Yersinia enterocolitica]HDL7069608.1 tail fiber assembly protein [Yersinia enterocolitica]HDL7098086.1 tail fiber assembly protein [Yersinia enterocolitica]
MTIIFDDTGHANVAGYVKVFYFHNITREYVGWSDEFIPVGVSLPGNSTTVDPGYDKCGGLIAVFQNDEWKQAEDHRGTRVFAISNGQQAVVDYIGPIHSDFTTAVPGTPYDSWNGTEWVTDVKRKRTADIFEADNIKTELITKASSFIAPMKDALEGGYIDEADKLILEEWQKYRYALTKVDFSNAPHIIWPKEPA